MITMLIQMVTFFSAATREKMIRHVRSYSHMILKDIEDISVSVNIFLLN